MNEAEWRDCTDPQQMLDFLRGKASDRKLILFCKAWYLASGKIKAIDHRWEVAERFAEGSASVRDIQALWLAPNATDLRGATRSKPSTACPFLSMP